jgi:hypothetical protein
MDSSKSSTKMHSNDYMAENHVNSTLEEQHKHPSSSGSMTLSGNNEQESSSESISPQHSNYAETSPDAEDEKREEAIAALGRAMSNSSATRSNPLRPHQILFWTRILQTSERRTESKA